MKTRGEEFYCLHNEDLIIPLCEMVDFVEKCLIIPVSVT